MGREPQNVSKEFASKSMVLVGLILVAVAIIVMIRQSSHETVARPADIVRQLNR